VYGVYRFLERLGNAIGPLLASVLVVVNGYVGAFVAICGLVFTCGVLFSFAMRLKAFRHVPAAGAAR
jgi:hypothetical protein